MDDQKKLRETRRANIRRLIQFYEVDRNITSGRNHMAKTLGLASPNYISNYLNNDEKNISSDKFRQWEALLGLPYGCFDEFNGVHRAAQENRIGKTSAPNINTSVKTMNDKPPQDIVALLWQELKTRGFTDLVRGDLPELLSLAETYVGNGADARMAVSYTVDILSLLCKPDSVHITTTRAYLGNGT